MRSQAHDSSIHVDASEVADGLRAWLASGAVQSPAGAFCAWKQSDTGNLAFEYPEITGYALTHLAQHEPTDAERAAGARAVGWLRERGSFVCLAARGEWDGQAVYNFDLAMIASGLMNFGRRTGDEEAPAAGAGLAEDLCTQHRAEGVLPSIRARHRRPSARSAWSTEGFAHLVKTVQCLLVHGGEEPRHVAGEIVEASRASQKPDGRFVTHPGDTETMLHPHLYAVEGLWMFAEVTGDEDARERAKAGVDWAWAHQLETGGFPCFVPISEPDEFAPEQFDATSQALRMAALLDIGGDGRAKAAARLAQVVRPDGEAGLALPHQPSVGPAHLNAWVSMFGFQALHVVQAGRAALPWHYLV